MAAENPPPRITEQIGAFVANTTLADIPADALERGRVHMLDTLGLAIAGAEAPAVDILLAYVARTEANGKASILGTTRRTAPSLAALVNGTAMHVDNFDDTAPQPSPDRNGGIHATAGVLPAALALAEANGLTGRALTEAVHVGLEIACKLNHAIDQRHYAGGFHVTGTLGIFGAAAAAAKLLALAPETVGHAMALATARAGGLRANFGSMVEQMHTGLAAEGGVVSAELAADGLEGAADIMETRFGWFEAAGGGFIADAIDGKLGRPWAIVDPGVWIKPYPSGSLTHPAMTALSDLIAAHGFAGKDVANIRVTTNQRLTNTLIHNRPTDAMQARFSMPFGVAALLVAGRAGLPEFTDDFVNRADVRAMMERVTYEAYPTVEPGYTNVTTFVEVTLNDGTVHKGRADFARGSTQAPMSWAAVTEKFEGCVAVAGWSRARARKVVDLVEGIETLDDVRKLTAAMGPG